MLLKTFGYNFIFKKKKSLYYLKSKKKLKFFFQNHFLQLKTLQQTAHKYL